MATLTGNQIDQTYSGLIKTTDNAALGAVEKEITDGVGNASTLKMGTTSASFVGDLDLTGATVTGLPADTTYDLAAAASGANINLNLTGSDATTDTVSIVAGTNITLSEAAGVVTIDAAGGGGSAVLPAQESMTPWDTKYTVAGTASSNWNYPFSTIADQFTSKAITENTIWFVPVTLLDGTTVNDVMLEVTTAKATNQGTVIALYDSVIVGGKLRINESLGSQAFDASTTGVKTASALNITVSGSPESIYWLAICNLDSTSGASFNIQSQAHNAFGGTYVSGSKYAFPGTPTSLNTLYRKSTFLKAGGYGGDPNFNLVLPTPYNYTTNPNIVGSDGQNDLGNIPMLFWR